MAAKKNNIKAPVAEKIFDLIEKFAGYGFNKSHSAAYALISYQTAYLKTYYPAYFMAAVYPLIWVIQIKFKSKSKNVKKWV